MSNELTEAERFARLMLVMGLDTSDPSVQAIMAEVESDGLPNHWSEVPLPPIDPNHPLIQLEKAHRSRTTGDDNP